MSRRPGRHGGCLDFTKRDMSDTKRWSGAQDPGMRRAVPQPAGPMKAIRRILACTDLSANSRKAAERAAQLGGQLDARVDLLHVAPPGSAHRLAAAQAGLDALVADLAPAAAGGLAWSVESGDPVDRLQAAGHGTQLLAIGATSRHALHRLVAGTTADRLIERSPCPVLVVKRAPAHAYRRVLVPVDFSPNAAIALELALEVAPGVDIEVLHVIDPSPIDAGRAGSTATAVVAATTSREPERADQAARQLDALLAQAVAAPGRRLVPCLAHGEAAAAILDKAARMHADLIVAGRHGRSALETLLVGSVTRRLLREADCDVLVSTGATRVGFDADALPPPYP